MNSSKNENVQKFLDYIEIMDNEKFDILYQARVILLNNYQNVDEKIMYGGIVFFFNSEMFSDYSLQIMSPSNFQGVF